MARFVVAEKSGRITLGTKLVKRYGKNFKVIDDDNVIVLVPISSKTSSKMPAKHNTKRGAKL